MIILVTLVLLVVVLAFLGYPLLYPSASLEETVAPVIGQREQLLAEREHALAALKDLEFEHSIGNLSSADYDALRGAQRYKAVAILRELDRLNAELISLDQASGSVAVLDARLEEEIGRARRRLASAGHNVMTCPRCSTVSAASARFCSQCGYTFGKAVTCPSCGAPQAHHDAFCAACGAALSHESSNE